MKIELNLVYSQSIFSQVFTLLARERGDANDESEVLDLIKKFLQGNIQILSESLANDDLINRILALDEFSISELYSLKYILAESGVDILVNEVAEMEVDPTEIPEGSKEYLIIDNLSDNNTFVRMATKFVMNSDEDNMFEVYNKIQEIYGFFTSELTAGYRNPLNNLMQVLKQNEDLIGKTPIQISDSISRIFEYLGKSIILLTNQ